MNDCGDLCVFSKSWRLGFGLGDWSTTPSLLEMQHWVNKTSALNKHFGHDCMGNKSFLNPFDFTIPTDGGKNATHMRGD
jgi:hypothetical protein